jgi:hypothetical protein
MKIRIVSKRDEIESIDSREKVVHLAFRPSNKDVFKLVKRCKNIEVIQIPASYRRTVSESIEIFLEMQGIALIEGDVWGHRKDINEYYTISPELLEKIKRLRNSGMSDDDISEKLSKEGKLNREMLNYILRKS